MTTQIGMRHQAQSFVRCDLCGRAGRHFYPANIGGIDYKFCTGVHLNRAQANYQYKQQHNIKQQPEEEDTVDYEEGINFGQSE